MLRRLRGAHGWIWTPGISADGRLLVTGGTDPVVRFWSLPDGRPLGPPLRFRQPPRDVQLSPDGRWVTVAFGSRLEIWDARTRRLARSVKSVDGIDMARFSPDGRLLAVANPNGAQVWSTEDWTPVTRVFVRACRSDLLGHDQPRQPHAGNEQLGRHRATLGHQERTGRSARRCPAYPDMESPGC